MPERTAAVHVFGQPADMDTQRRHAVADHTAGVAGPAHGGSPGRPVAASASRRRRLWELDGAHHCPVLGTGVPIGRLRELAQRHAAWAPPADDYALHAAAVAECRKRTALSEALQADLDRHAQVELRTAARWRTVDELAAWWQASVDGPHLAAVLWAALTHPQCQPLLEHRMLGDVHMRQHQLGSHHRHEAARVAALEAELAAQREAARRDRERQARELQALRERADRVAAQALQCRARLIARDTEVQQLHERLQALEGAAPGLATRVALAEENRRLAGCLSRLQRQLARAAPAGPGDAHGSSAPVIAIAPAARPAAPTPVSLQDRAVLCVGGRTDSVPRYRRLVERRGGRFLHHDGGHEEQLVELDARLAAADLVVCQTGCMSHGAMWRVKAHCRRTGKCCVFVGSPGPLALARALGGAIEATTHRLGGNAGTRAADAAAGA